MLVDVLTLFRLITPQISNKNTFLFFTLCFYFYFYSYYYYANNRIITDLYYIRHNSYIRYVNE